jgi:hypothetical protein
LPSVWSMKHKRDIKTWQVYKWQQTSEWWELLWNICTSSYLVFDLTPSGPLNPEQMAHKASQLHPGMHTSWHWIRHVDGTTCWNQTKYGIGKTHILKLLKNLYGQKQAKQVWNNTLLRVSSNSASSNQKMMNVTSSAVL